jgi:hypothetical protein
VSFEGGAQVFVQLGGCQDQDIVPGSQFGVTFDGDGRAIPHYEADPGVAREVGQVLDGAAIGSRAGLDREPVHAAGLIAQPHPQRPRLGLYHAHRNMEPPGGGGRQAALHHDGEHHHDRDDAVQTLSTGHVRAEQEAAQQDRYRPFKPSKQDKVALIAL